MKKYIILILLIGLTLIAFLVYNTMKVEESRMKTFAQSGYILQSFTNNDNSQDVKRHYFNDEETYKKTYGEKIVFNDTNGKQVEINNENFIHYSDGSISALKKGVIINLQEVDTEPICYYSINEHKILKKISENKYGITNLDKDLEFNNVI